MFDKVSIMPSVSRGALDNLAGRMTSMVSGPSPSVAGIVADVTPLV